MNKMRDDDKTSRGRRRGSSGRGDHYAILEDEHEQSRLEYSDDGFEREGLLCDHSVGDGGDVRGGGHRGSGGDGLKGSKGDDEKVEDDAAENITSVVKTRKVRLRLHCSTVTYKSLRKKSGHGVNDTCTYE